MNSYNPEDNQGALERLGIPVQTTPPEQVLTAGKAKSIRFRVSRPQGYAYGDVESYQFDYVIPTLEWYAQTLHQRDLAIHKLGELIDRTEVDLLNAKAQLDNKDYNEAIGLAVESSERDEEVERLLELVEALKAQLADAHAQLENAHQAPITTPDGEVYTREEVEGFLAAAVEDANRAKDEEYAAILAQREQEAIAKIETARQEGRNEGSSTGYSEEDVQHAIQNAVTEIEHEKDQHYQLLLSQKDSELESAERRVQEAISAQPTGYTQEELEEAIAAAVTAKESELLEQMENNQAPTDQIAELTNEGDLKLKAEVKTLRKSLKELDEYCKQMEDYVAVLEGKAPKENETPESIHGRPLPKLRADDL